MQKLNKQNFFLYLCTDFLNFFLRQNFFLVFLKIKNVNQNFGQSLRLYSKVYKLYLITTLVLLFT